jgi:hypothetical protein
VFGDSDVYIDFIRVMYDEGLLKGHEVIIVAQDKPYQASKKNDYVFRCTSFNHVLIFNFFDGMF